MKKCKMTDTTNYSEIKVELYFRNCEIDENCIDENSFRNDVNFLSKFDNVDIIFKVIEEPSPVKIVRKKSPKKKIKIVKKKKESSKVKSPEKLITKKLSVKKREKDPSPVEEISDDDLKLFFDKKFKNNGGKYVKSRAIKYLVELRKESGKLKSRMKTGLMDKYRGDKNPTPKIIKFLIINKDTFTVDPDEIPEE